MPREWGAGPDENTDPGVILNIPERGGDRGFILPYIPQDALLPGVEKPPTAAIRLSLARILQQAGTRK